MANQRALGLNWSINAQSATVLSKYVSVLILTMSQKECQRSVNGASINFDLASSIIQQQSNADNPKSTYWDSLWAKMLVTISHLAPTIERSRRVNNDSGGVARYTPMNCIVLFLNPVLHSQSLQSVLVYNITNMHAMSYRSDLFVYSCRAII